MDTNTIPDDLRSAARLSAASFPDVRVADGRAFVVPWLADTATAWLCSVHDDETREEVQYVGGRGDADELDAIPRYVFPAAWLDA